MAPKAGLHDVTEILFRHRPNTAYTMSSFRFNASRVFLTYSDLPKRFSPDILYHKISEKAEVDQYLISQEMHQSGSFHLHGYFKFAEKQDTKDARFFDVSYYSVPRHPNIEPVKGPSEPFKLYRYIAKDPVSLVGNIEDIRPTWLRLLEDSKSYNEFLTETMWKLNRIDNYAGYKTYRDLADQKFGRFT